VEFVAQGKTDGKSPEKRNQVLVDKTENLDFDVAKLTWEEWSWPPHNLWLQKPQTLENYAKKIFWFLYAAFLFSVFSYLFWVFIVSKYSW
jgi:hypothetical protein